MDLPNELISQFVKITKDDTNSKNETTVYGTVKMEDKKTYVILDGSTVKTPATTITNVQDGERVTVMIKNHTAIITGNISYPSAKSADVENVTDKIENAAKTATNYIKSTTNGLIVGNVSASTLGNNILIDTDRVDIRNGDTVYASYGVDYIQLANTNQNAIIEMCAGAAKMYHMSDNIVESRFIIESNYEIDLITQYAIFNDVLYDDGRNSGEALIRIESHDPSSDTPVAGGLVDIKATTNSVSTAINMKDGVLTLSADNKISLDGPVYTSGDIILPNDYEIRGINTSGNSMELIGLSSGNNTVVGFGSYDQGVGQTRIYGQAIRMYVGSASADYKPYYEAGDSVSGLWWGGGFISSSSKEIYFTIPLAKPVIGDPTVTVTNVDGFQVRQDGNYVYGATSSTYVAPSSLTGTLSWDGSAVRVTATMDNATNAVNNAPCGIACNIKIAFS